MKDKTGGVATEEFGKLKPKMYQFFCQAVKTLF